MSSPRFLDTNVLIRYFTRDDQEKGRRAYELIARVERGEEPVILTHLVLFEVIFTLQKSYGVARPSIRTWLEALLSLPSIRVDDRAHLVEALTIFVEANISFADAYNAVFMRRAGIAEVYSWDTEFDRVPWVTRLEPT